MSKIIGLFLVMALITSTISSCKKYEEGGPIRKTEKNLQKSWKLVQYLRNGTDETAQLLISSYQEKYGDKGSYTRDYIDKDGQKITENGTWSFEKDDKRLLISGVGSIEITANAGTVSSSYYNILKLDDSEFWYYYTNGGDRHEFHLSKN